MRLKILEAEPRQWFSRWRLRIVQWLVGIRPGPIVLMSHRPELFRKEMQSYIMHGVAGSRAWNRGEAELFSAFVSQLNSCHF